MIKAVLFDFWGTLMIGDVQKKSLIKANKLAHKYLVKQGYKISFEDYSKKREEFSFSKYWDIVDETGKIPTPEEIFKKIIGNIKEKHASELVKIHEIWDFVDGRFRNECKYVFKELKKRNIKIGLLTNAWLRQSLYWLKKYKLDKYFDAFIISCDVCMVKPYKEIFELAAKKLGVSLKECVMVGDSHRDDISGAHNAGLACAIAIEPFKKDDSLAKPYATVKNLKEILPILDNINGNKKSK